MTNVTKEKGKLDKTEKGILGKGFRANTDIENFYRFVNENNMRREAKFFLAKVLEKVKVKPSRRSRKIQ